jgi:hypothetical protein
MSHLTTQTLKIIDRIDFDTVSLNGFVLAQILKRISKLEKDIATMHGQISNLQERVTSLEVNGVPAAQLTQLQNDVSEIQSFMSNTFQDVYTGEPFNP